MASAQGKSYVVYFKRKAPISVSVENIVAICDTSVTMVATITGNTTHRTFRWEFVSGPSIGWLTSQDLPIATWAPTDIIRNDRLFRFYVDKDDPQTEEVYDVWVYATPTERAYPVASRRVKGGTNSYISEGVYYTSPEYPMADEIFAIDKSSTLHPRIFLIEREGISTSPQVPTEPTIIESSSFYLLWLPPLNQFNTTDPNRTIKNYTVQETINGTTWTDVGTYTEPQLISVTNGKSYRVIAMYDDSLSVAGLSAVTYSGEPRNIVISEPIYVGSSPSILQGFRKPFIVENVIDNLVTREYQENQIEISSYNVADWKLVTLPNDPPDEIVPATFYRDREIGLAEVTSYTVLDWKLITCDWNTNTELDDDQVSFGTSDITVGYEASLITDYLVVGGGTIGG